MMAARKAVITRGAAPDLSGGGVVDMTDETTLDDKESVPEPQAGIRTDIPHTARMYDYYLGGDQLPRGPRGGGRGRGDLPRHLPGARENRAFMHRATRVLAR